MINKHQLLKDLQADLKACEVPQKDWVAKRDEWVSETYGHKYKNEVKGKSQLVSKDIKRQLEWMIPGMTDPFLSTTDVIKCNPITFEDIHSARQNELLLNTQFTRQFDRYNFITRSARVLATEGTLVVQAGWEYRYEEVDKEVEVIAVNELTGQMEIQKQVIKDKKVLVNKPTAKVCRGEDIYIDPTAMGDLDKAQFIIYRYETDLSTLRKDGRYKNLKRVAQSAMGEDYDYRPEDETYFKFSDVARKKVVVYEYWGNYDMTGDGIATPMVCVWTDQNVIIRLEDNPYPDKKSPFLVVPFTPIPFQLQGEALAENIGDNQKVKTAITRGFIDNMALSNNGQVGIRKGALSVQDKKKFLLGKNFEFNGSPSDFWQGSYNQIPGSAFDMLVLMDNAIESQTGQKSFSGGISGTSLGGSATGIRAATDATGMRRVNLVRNIAENLMKPLMRKWMAYNSEFLSDEEVIRITNDKFVTVKRDDLEGRIDVGITIATAEDNSAKSQQLSFLLQTLGNSVPFELTKIVLADITRLNKMPELTKKLEDFEQKPDTQEQQAKALEMKRLELENNKLMAEIKDIYSRAQENGVDVRLKNAKASVEEAKASKLESDKDMVDLNFLKSNEDVDHQNKLQLEELKHKANMQSIREQAAYGDHNIGMEN